MRFAVPFTCLLLGLGAAARTEYVSRTDEDQEAMRAFTPFLGTWLFPEERGFELAWGFEEKTVHLREFRIVDDDRELLAEAMAGWHYGRREIVYHEFVRDHRPFEVMNSGVFRGEGESLLREFTSFDPDGTTLDWRERYDLLPGDGLELSIDYRDEEAGWQPWGLFRARREESSPGDAPPERAAR